MGRRRRRAALDADDSPAPAAAPRLRMGPETPGAVRRGPPITVTCECGQRHELFYGERWTCPRCGRSYDSTRIPVEQYAAIRRLQLRYRVLPVALGVLVLALAVVFTLTGNVVGVFFLLPVALITWFVFLRPTHRRRYRAAIADLPRWELRAE